MKRSMSWLVVLALTAGCGGGDDHGEEGEHTHADGTTHGGDEDHDEADAEILGNVELGDVSCRVLLYEVEEENEVALDVIPSAPGVTAVRAWYGDEAGTGSRKAKLDKEGDKFHGHVELPASPPEASAYWVEVEGEGGSKKAGFKAPS